MSALRQWLSLYSGNGHGRVPEDVIDELKRIAPMLGIGEDGDVVMSAITYAELEYGAAVSANPE